MLKRLSFTSIYTVHYSTQCTDKLASTTLKLYLLTSMRWEHQLNAWNARSKSNLAAADEAVFHLMESGVLLAARLNVNNDNENITFHISHTRFTALAFVQQQDGGGVSTCEEVPGCWREENARHPVVYKIQGNVIQHLKRNLRFRLFSGQLYRLLCFVLSVCGLN